MLLSFNWIINWTELLGLRVPFKQNYMVTCCFQVLLLTCYQYFQYFCNIFHYFQYIFCTFFVLSKYWENKGQNWWKNKLGFLLYELPHRHICSFLCFFSHWNAYNQDLKNRGRIFFLSQYFLDNLFLTVIVQNVISKFVAKAE